MANAGEAGRAGVLRVAQFNIRRARGDDGRRDLRRVARELAGADVAVLNEVGYANGQLARLSRLLDLEPVPLATERRWGQDSFGNGLLAGVPIEDYVVIPLPADPNGRGARNATLFRVPLATIGGEGYLHLLATHVAQHSDRQLDALLDLFDGLAAPALLAGDLNATGGRPRLAETLAVPGTADVLGDLAGVDPSEHIDWLILRGGGSVRATAAGLRDSPASDHPVVWVDLVTTGETHNAPPRPPEEGPPRP